MINKKLLSFDRGALRFVGANVAFQWLGMLCNVIFVRAIAQLVGAAFAGSLTSAQLWQNLVLCLATVPMRFAFTMLASAMSDQASKDVKRTLRSSITDNYPLAGVLIPEWNMGSYISQTQLASLLGVDDTATSLQSMSDFQLDLKKIKKVQPENAKAGYLYFQLETDDTAADSPVLTLGVEKSGLLRAASPAVHILLDIPAHGIHTELTGTVTPAAPTLTAPTSRMQDSDIASLVQLRQTVESVVQFVQGAASGTQSAS